MDKAENVLVSVVVATYHSDEELFRAISSLLNQTHKNTEIIVVDDNADDLWNQKVAGLLRDRQEKYGKTIRHIVNEANQGSAETRNIGIAAANGEYITFLDDDDIYLPEKIEKQLADLISAGADYGITDLYLYNKNNRFLARRIRNYIKEDTTNELMRYHLMYHMTGTDTLMFKTEYLRSIGGFPRVDIGDEFYLVKEAILHGGKLVYSPHCYVKAYVHVGKAERLSSGQRKIDGENALYAEKKKYFPYLKRKDIRYIRSRHYAVIAFAELRRRAVGGFVWNAVMSFACSPGSCVKILTQHGPMHGTGRVVK